MKTNRREFIKSMNWALAGIMGLLGFVSCRANYEYGSPYADYTVKGKVINKVNRKPIQGIRVGYGYNSSGFHPMYGVPQTPYQPKAYVSVTTNTKGEFKLTERSYNLIPIEGTNGLIPVYVEDIDGTTNGLFQSETLQVDFSDAKHSGKSSHWYEGEYTVNLDVELTEIDPK